MSFQPLSVLRHMMALLEESAKPQRSAPEQNDDIIWGEELLREIGGESALPGGPRNPWARHIARRGSTERSSSRSSTHSLTTSGGPGSPLPVDLLATIGDLLAHAAAEGHRGPRRRRPRSGVPDNSGNEMPEMRAPSAIPEEASGGSDTGGVPSAASFPPDVVPAVSASSDVSEGRTTPSSLPPSPATREAFLERYQLYTENLLYGARDRLRAETDALPRCMRDRPKIPLRRAADDAPLPESLVARRREREEREKMLVEKREETKDRIFREEVVEEVKRKGGLEESENRIFRDGVVEETKRKGGLEESENRIFREGVVEETKRKGGLEESENRIFRDGVVEETKRKDSPEEPENSVPEKEKEEEEEEERVAFAFTRAAVEATAEGEALGSSVWSETQESGSEWTRSQAAEAAGASPANAVRVTLASGESILLPKSVLAKYGFKTSAPETMMERRRSSMRLEAVPDPLAPRSVIEDREDSASKAAFRDSREGEGGHEEVEEEDDNDYSSTSSSEHEDEQRSVLKGDTTTTTTTKKYLKSDNPTTTTTTTTKKYSTETPPSNKGSASPRTKYSRAVLEAANAPKQWRKAAPVFLPDQGVVWRDDRRVSAEDLRRELGVESCTEEDSPLARMAAGGRGQGHGRAFRLHHPFRTLPVGNEDGKEKESTYRALTDSDFPAFGTSGGRRQEFLRLRSRSDIDPSLLQKRVPEATVTATLSVPITSSTSTVAPSISTLPSPTETTKKHDTPKKHESTKIHESTKKHESSNQHDSSEPVPISEATKSLDGKPVTAYRAAFVDSQAHPDVLLLCGGHAVVNLRGEQAVVARAGTCLPHFTPEDGALCYMEFTLESFDAAKVTGGAFGPEFAEPAVSKTYESAAVSKKHVPTRTSAYEAVGCAIGLSSDNCPVVGTLGSQLHSVGLTSSGRLVCGSQWATPGPGPAKFGVGDTVGILVRFLGPWKDEEGLFAVQLTFSVNGRAVAFTAPLVVPDATDLFPAVSLRSPSVRVKAAFTAQDIHFRNRSHMVVLENANAADPKGHSHSDASPAIHTGGFIAGCRHNGIFALDGSLILPPESPP